MSSEKRVRWFEDILANIARIERFTAGMDLAKLGEEEQIFFAVLHALLIISESARRLGTEAEKLAPGPPWRAIRDLGNVLRHAYDGVDPAVICRIVRDDLGSLRQAVERALQNPPMGENP
ncbi:MAG TPA: HepT-like ribonuclease domain-containing protein [Stellaceae bacterium]